ncbi:hypothetical protein DVH24_033982 [Malus domestica]|uniref:Uncharacterized protein n=1 Tax=Malus domestica TaxID=3750 RepID=A0A498KUG8_MALDO|nr:hypothetical protein DVH24_033982 [Malus domestica]
MEGRRVCVWGSRERCSGEERCNGGEEGERSCSSQKKMQGENHIVYIGGSKERCSGEEEGRRSYERMAGKKNRGRGRTEGGKECRLNCPVLLESIRKRAFTG